MSQPDNAAPLRVLSFNMQVGIGTRRYREYVTRGWRHVLPSQSVRDNLERIGALIADYDIIGLQEIDAGSRRSRYQNQIESIAARAGLRYWHAQVNRDLGRVAQHGLGLISRYPPRTIAEHRLPGRLPGRGALIARFGEAPDGLTVVVTHLSLGSASRARQLAAICQAVAADRHVVLMGDTNCSTSELIGDAAIASSDLRIYDRLLPTFPAWRPRRGIDHILTSKTLEVHDARVVDAVLSDHRPVSMQIGLPATVARSLRAGPPAQK